MKPATVHNIKQWLNNKKSPPFMGIPTYWSTNWVCYIYWLGKQGFLHVTVTPEVASKLITSLANILGSYVTLHALYMHSTVYRKLSYDPISSVPMYHNTLNNHRHPAGVYSRTHFLQLCLEPQLWPSGVTHCNNAICYRVNVLLSTCR